MDWHVATLKSVALGTLGVLLLLLAALAHALLTLLGAAGERCGLDRRLRTNTSKRRQLSLYNQGTYRYEAIPNMREERLALLMNAYVEELREHAFLKEIFGAIGGDASARWRWRSAPPAVRSRQSLIPRA